MDDRALLELLRRDGDAGMEALLARYAPLLRYVVGGVLRDRQEAEDCYSAVTELLWRRLGDYDPERGSLTAWLTALARNTALNHLKAQLRRERHLAAPEETDAAAPDTPEDALLRRERAERLNAAIARLGETDRTIFYRRYYYLQPVAQIAAEMGMTERSAEGRLYRLRQRLRRELGGDAP